MHISIKVKGAGIDAMEIQTEIQKEKRWRKGAREPQRNGTTVGWTHRDRDRTRKKRKYEEMSEGADRDT